MTSIINFKMKKFSSSEKYDIFPKGQKKKPQKWHAKLPPKAKKNRQEIQFYEIGYI